MKVTRPGRKWVGVLKKRRKKKGREEWEGSRLVIQQKEYPYRRCGEVRSWSCIRVGGIVCCVTTGAVRRWN